MAPKTYRCTLMLACSGTGDRFTFTTPLGDLDILATAEGAAPFPDLKARAVWLDIGSVKADSDQYMLVISFGIRL